MSQFQFILLFGFSLLAFFSKSTAYVIQANGFDSKLLLNPSRAISPNPNSPDPILPIPSNANTDIDTNTTKTIDPSSNWEPSTGLPVSWKAAIGLNTFVLVITLAALLMLAWYLRRQYRRCQARRLMMEDEEQVKSRKSPRVGRSGRWNSLGGFGGKEEVRRGRSVRRWSEEEIVRGKDGNGEDGSAEWGTRINLKIAGK